MHPATGFALPVQVAPDVLILQEGPILHETIFIINAFDRIVRQDKGLCCKYVH